MAQKGLLYMGLSSIFLLLLAGCGQQKTVFPTEDDFEIQIELVSVTEYDETNYQLQIKTILKNNSMQDLQVYSGEHLLNLLVDGEYVSNQINAVLATYSLASLAEYTEIKTIQIPKSKFIDSQLQVQSKFYIEDKNATKQNYVIQSESYVLTEEDL